jgi:hypothetical protein
MGSALSFLSTYLSFFLVEHVITFMEIYSSYAFVDGIWGSKNIIALTYFLSTNSTVSPLTQFPWYCLEKKWGLSRIGQGAGDG